MADIEIEGLDDLLVKLDKLCSVEQVSAAMQQACLVVEASAKEKAPKHTGELQGSIQSRVDVLGTEVMGTVFSPLEYAPYVEYGTGLFADGGKGRKDVPWCYLDEQGEWQYTSGMKPQPFLHPALEENKKEIKKILKKGVIPKK